jgi:hypothetical protein
MYSINYTIDTHGHRLTRGGGPNADTYFFFGDSYTYGVGVDDNETLPSRFSEALGYRYTVANLAFSGLGPHHMLRLLETNEIDPAAVTGKVRRAYYSLIADHQDRVVGRYLYSLTGPKYLLDRGGRPVFQGRFLDNLDGRIGWLAEQAGGAPARLRVLAMQALLPPRYRQDLVVGILAESAKILRERYGAELVVLIWSWPDPASLVDNLRGRGIRGNLVADMIGDVDAPGLRQIPGSDDHPTAKADRLLGAALADLENPVHNISAGR